MPRRLNYTNLMELPDNNIAVLDFSDSGEDFLISDIAAFFWRADFDGVGEILNPAFVAGYEAVRGLTPAEKAALPLFRARAIWVSRAPSLNTSIASGRSPGLTRTGAITSA